MDKAQDERLNIAFIIPGEARGKGRPRFVRATGVAFTPEKTASYENLVKLAAQAAMDGLPPSTSPIMVDISVYRGIPAGWSKKKREAALCAYAPTGYDVDNLAKAILDGMSDVVFANDRQVVGLHVTKRYSFTPKAVVQVLEIPDALR